MLMALLSPLFVYAMYSGPAPEAIASTHIAQPAAVTRTCELTTEWTGVINGRDSKTMRVV